MLSKTFTALITGISFAGAVLVTSPKQADAHATSVGFENGGAIGTVNVWLGTYNHGGHHLEGSMKLEGVNGTVFYLTVGFSIGAGVGPTPTFDGLSANPATTKPTGLIDGVTNFYIPNFSDPNAALVGTDPGLAGGINHWQGAVFSGLSAGDYQFTPPAARQQNGRSAITT